MTKPWYTVENVAEIPSPSLLVYPDRIRDNLRQMITLVGGASSFRPHVKTHKMPQIIKMKLELGITKFKASTIAEAEMTADAGGKDILLAYQPVGPNVARFIQLTKKFPVRVNIIEYNPIGGVDYVKSDEDRIDHFAGYLADNGVTVTVRRSRGKDIDAACGQLANKG